MQTNFQEWFADIGFDIRIGCGVLIALVLFGVACLLLLVMLGLLWKLLAS